MTDAAATLIAAGVGEFLVILGGLLHIAARQGRQEEKVDTVAVTVHELAGKVDRVTEDVATIRGALGVPDRRNSSTRPPQNPL